MISENIVNLIENIIIKINIWTERINHTFSAHSKCHFTVDYERYVSTYMSTACKYLQSVRWCHVSGLLFIMLIVSNVISRRGTTRLRGHIKTESLLILTNQGGKLETRGPTWTSKAKPTHSNPHLVFLLPKSPFKESSQITLTIPIVTDHWETNVIPSKCNYSC